MSDGKELPVKLAKEIAEKYGYDIIALVGWNQIGNQHVTTFGQTLTLCDWAAKLGNKIKSDILKWPDEFCHAEPKPAEIRKKYDLLLSRIQKAEEEIEQVGEEKWAAYKKNHTGPYDEGYSDGIDRCADIIRKHVPVKEVKNG